MSIKRRTVIKGSLAALAGFWSGAEVIAKTCGEPTPANDEGPFYPVGNPGGSDLTLIAGKKPAQGSIIYIRGRLMNSRCRPIDRAVVEIWQADARGNYLHPDHNADQLDESFKYRGRHRTGKDGGFFFKTLMPGAYGSGWSLRTPHIHYKVLRDGEELLTTQMFFEGQEYNRRDGLYRSLSPEERRAVTLKLAKGTGSASDGRVGEFNIVV